MRMAEEPEPVRNSSPALMACVGASGTNAPLEAALHSTRPLTSATRSAPCASSADGESNNAKTIRTFLISPLLRSRPVCRGFLSDAANRCGENPKPPETNQTRCRDRAADGLGGLRAASRRYANFVRVQPALQRRRWSEPSFHDSFPRSRHKTKNYAVRPLDSS